VTLTRAKKFTSAGVRRLRQRRDRGDTQELAKLAGTNEREVSRALSRLVELGALLRTGRGRYMIHPSAAWNGSLASREAAERKLEPVD
jgi:DNA-binding IclR family transcriptional regulator